ncbi:trypsin-like serine protease [Halieaceae bacterium IMCC14734]|uniref:Trypsin-like serine protease n=1 Tax=Candidatus Litorirhabdus singularis TaxID=2518993 RepID=A0ABT3TJG3_9GAMM|nr:trypsin-like serine protease [Candidatus Litorirhabdus singularis]
MNKALKLFTWPAIAGLLAAVLLLQWHNFQNLEHKVNAIAERGSYADVVASAVPAVVNIYTSKLVRERIHPLMNDPFFRRFFRSSAMPRERMENSLGSGVIVSSEGLILTNRHVVAGADEIRVAFYDGREVLARVVGSDADTDLAVLQVELDNLQAITQGSPDQARVGDVVLAIGNPYGFGHSVSQGIISGLGRYGLKLSTYEDFIQTDAAINQGNSGGALIDTRGHLLGINTANVQSEGAATNIGLTIPADLALNVMADLVQYGKVIRGWMGLDVKPVPSNGGSALLVKATDAGGPAQKAGLLPGDIITHFDEQAIVDARLTMQQIAQMRPGDIIDIQLRRNTQQLSLQAIIGERPSNNR